MFSLKFTLESGSEIQDLKLFYLFYNQFIYDVHASALSLMVTWNLWMFIQVLELCSSISLFLSIFFFSLSIFVLSFIASSRTFSGIKGHKVYL